MLFPPTYFGPSPTPPSPIDPGTILEWEIKAVPASQLAISGEWQKVLVSATDADGAPLGPNDIGAIGLKMAFVADLATPQSDWEWHAMNAQLKVEGGIYTPAYLRVGPLGVTGVGIIGLPPGRYERFVRANTVPPVVKKLTPITVEGPNP